MPAKSRTQKNEPEMVAIALQMSPETEEDTRDLAPAVIRTKVAGAYQFNTDDHGSVVVPVGASILVSKEAAEHLKGLDLPKGVQWASKPQEMPQGTPAATTTITGQSVSAPVTTGTAGTTNTGTGTAATTNTGTSTR